MGFFYLMKVETISFKTEYAEKYGIDCAILIQGIQLGLMINRNKPTHNKMGKVWMYNSVKDWHETYPFMSESTIKRALLRLKESKVIEVMQLDSNPMNKTNWYTLTNALGHFDPIEEVNLNKSKQYKTNSIKQTFIIPTVGELKNEFPNIDAESFHDFYTSKGWKIGKDPMKDWRAAARNWERRNNPKPTTTFAIRNKATLDDD
jgi:hypothetical protein